MKFAALALALLLAVGSQAAPMQSDAPSQLDHVRSVADIYLTKMVESLKRAVSQLDDTAHAEYKTAMTQRLDDMHTQIKDWQARVSPYTDSVYKTLVEATADTFKSINDDIQTFNSETMSQQENLKTIIEKHVQQYRAVMEPFISEQSAKSAAEFEALKTRLTPIIQNLRQQLAANVEETKEALMPIFENGREKFVKHVENLKQMADPYVTEYKEQLKSALAQAQSLNTGDATALQGKIEPYTDGIKTNLQAIFEAVISSFNKQ